MDKQLAQYIRNHIFFVTSVVIVGFTLLVAGEYYLYRQTMHLNQMISEGFMQVRSSQEIDKVRDSEMKDEKTVKEDVDDGTIEDKETEKTE